MIDAPEHNATRASEAGPLVSVIIPVYNCSNTLRRALSSVARQTMSNYEIIVVDDGSTDGSAAVARSFTGIDIKVIRHEINRGASVARNSGIRSARGTYIALLDSDDEWFPHKLEKQLHFLTDSTHQRSVCCSAYLFFKRDVEGGITINSGSDDTPPNLLWGCTLSPGTPLVANRACFEQVGLFDKSLKRLEDWDWLLRCSRRYHIYVFPEPLARVYSSPTIANSIHVTQALRRMNERRALYGLNWATPIDLLQFRSTIFLERAAIYYRRGHILPALWNGLLSFVIYPFRNRAFFRKVTNLMVRALTTRGTP